MRIRFVFGLIFWFVPCIIIAQSDSFSKYITDSLESFIVEGISEWDIPGLSIAVVHNGEVIMNKAFGVKNISLNNPVDIDTKFMIGSLSKAITSAAVVSVSNKGALALDDPISKWIPEFKNSTSKNLSNSIIEDILTGRTGLGNHQGDFLFWKTKLDATDLIRILPQMEFESDVRRKFIYSNLPYLLIEPIINSAVKNSWASIISEEVFNPLEMNDSYPSISKMPDSVMLNLATPHMKVMSSIFPLSNELIENMGPAGSIVSTSNDISKWIVEFMNMNGVFPNSVKKTIRKPYQLRGYRTNKENPEQLRFLFSGMGWNISDEFDKLTYSHDGGTDGFKSGLMIIPEKQYGVIILTNSRSHNFTSAIIDELHYKLMQQPFQHFNKEYFVDYNQAEIEEQKEEFRIKKLIDLHSKTQVDNQRYVGIYDNPHYGKMTIVENKGELKLELNNHQFNLTANLYNLGDEKFWIQFSSQEFSPTKIEFTLDKDKIVGFTINIELSKGENYWFSKE